MAFGTALHAMVALAYNDGAYLPSSMLAQSIGANAVTVRRVISQLGEAGLVETQTGPGGGARLARSPARITVGDVYDAMGRPDFVRGHDKAPNESCEVSACMPNIFERLNDEIAHKADAVFRRTTLKKLLEEELPAR